MEFETISELKDLVKEFATLLGNEASKFIEIKKSSLSNKQLFTVLKDGGLVFCLTHIASLMSQIMDEKQIPMFLEECQNQFNKTINAIKKDRERLLKMTKGSDDGQ